ncbi:MAG: CHASE domain-containing protein [Verrucomicrobiota bacterium]
MIPPSSSAFPLATAIAVGAAPVRATERRLQSEAEAGAKQEALERMEQLRGAMMRTLEILHAVQALFEVKPEVGRAEFRRFVRSALKRLPELQALEWIPCVSAGQRADFEAAAAADGLAGFHFTEIAPDGQLLMAGRRDEYLPVFYVEPVTENFPVLGLDLLADARRREALERAARTGLPTATSPLKLAQVRDRGLGFLVVMAVRDPVDERLLGFCLAAFRVERLVEEIFAPLVGRGVRMEIRDASEEEGDLLYSAGDGEIAPDGWTYDQDLPLVGRVWRFRFCPTADFHTADPDWLRRAAESLQRTNEILEERVQERTGQLAELNAALQVEIEERKRAEAFAAAANRAKSLFLAEMSHEIRTPLNAILGYTQLLQRDPRLADSQLEAVRAITEGGNHLLCLVDGVLDLTKIESGHMELNPVDFDLTVLVNGLAAMFGPRCQQKGLRLRVESLGPTSAWVRGDERKLRQVVVNLLGNAVKFTERGEIRLRVVPVGATGTYRFEVIDTGPGIPQSAQRAVFEPFCQEEGGRRAGGTGLGLSLARRLVELMGGSLEVNSRPGWGSNFFFALSLPPAGQAEPGAASTRRPPRRLAPGVNVRALVVDDVPVNRELLAEVLGSLGCEVRAVPGGGEAINALREAPADIVFMDVRMSGLDGIETARVLRRAEGTRPRLVRYATGAFAHDRAEAAAAGFDDHLPKPFRFEQVADCLRALPGVAWEPTATSVPPAPAPGGTARPFPLASTTVEALRAAAEIGDFSDLRRLIDQVPAPLQARLRLAVERFDTTALLVALDTLDTP